MTLFSTKPYEPAALRADGALAPEGAEAAAPGLRPGETPLEYHLQVHRKTCSCGALETWSELTLLLFSRDARARIVRAAATFEYNIPFRIHYHDEEHASLCSLCAARKAEAHLPLLPVPEAPAPVARPRSGWREATAALGAKPAPRKKKPVTDEDLIA
jgi:hypothetical protein